MHARSRQFALDVPAHGFAGRFDRTGDLGLTTVPQAPCVACKRRQRCLQPMSEIGGPAAGPRGFRITRVKERVDLGDQRPNFERRTFREATAFARCDRGRPRRVGAPAAAARG